MRLFHRTDAAAAILSDGFCDTSGSYGTSREHSGVWLSDTPLEVNDGVEGAGLLAVEIPEDEIADFEWVEEFKTYREWLVPAAIVNRHPVEAEGAQA